jgi:hypothetical protein
MVRAICLANMKIRTILINVSPDIRARRSMLLRSVLNHLNDLNGASENPQRHANMQPVCSASLAAGLR